jgi:aryl-alcohol dehydrogenase-like predicted oxidoreductase
MKKVLLGQTGIKVSTFCLGAMYFGSRTNKEMSYRLLDQFCGAGGDFIDTANIYAHWVPGSQGGESETLLGEWMQERKNRSKLFLATKVGFEYPNVERGLSANQIITECEKSLKRLRVDTIDLFYAHKDDQHTPIEETLEAFDRLVKSGKVRFVGASNFSAWRLEEARWVSETNKFAGYCCVQQRYSYLRPKPGASFYPQVAVNDDLLDYVRRKGITLLAYSVLLSGAYTRPDRVPMDQYIGADTNKRLETVGTISQDLGATANQVVLAWMLQSEPPVLPLIAASTSEQMQENLDALELNLTKDQLERLTTASA